MITNKQKGLMESLKDAGIVVASISVLIILFGLTTLVSNFEIGGGAITGEVVVIMGDLGEDYNVSLDSDEATNELNDNLVCWIEGGIGEQDIIVIGNLLRDFECPEGEKKNVTAVIEDDCVLVSVGDEAATRLCSEGLIPEINILLTEEKDEGFPEDFSVPETNYYFYIIFFIFIVFLVFVWREYEFGVKTDLELKAEQRYLRKKEEREEKVRKAIESGLTAKEKKIVYLNPAPPFDEKKAKMIEKANKLTKTKIAKSDMEKRKKREKEKNKLISEFNTSAERVNKLIIKGKLNDGRKEYLQLFDIYSSLVIILGKKNRTLLDKIMQYLCNYLDVLEKIRGSKRKGMKQKIDREAPFNKITGKTEVLSMEKLDQMRDLIKKKHYDQAKNMFYGGRVEKFNIDDAFRNTKTNKEKDELKEIEIRHDKLLKEKIVNISEDDYYKFMLRLTELRKQIKNEELIKKKN